MIFDLFSTPVKEIDCETLKKWLENDEAILIDVREIEENESSRIKGSKLIPLAKICLEKVSDAKCKNPNCTCENCTCENCQCHDKKLVIHCRSGMRSASACKRLLSENPNLEIYNLKGGILAWIDAGNEILSDDQ